MEGAPCSSCDHDVASSIVCIAGTLIPFFLDIAQLFQSASHAGATRGYAEAMLRLC